LTIILVTHNPRLAALADRTIELRDGRIHAA
jgi:ABC-type lipoprotein export system ATPase subunit